MNFFVISTITLTFIIYPTNAANSNFAFPLPQGTYKVTNNSKGHEAYLPADGNFKTDFQSAEIPENLNLSPEKNSARCFSYGTPILAAREGTVSKVIANGQHHSPLPDYGAHIIIDHEDGSQSVYGHMINHSNEKYVKVGQQVKTGQILGLMGDTGYILSNQKQSPCLTDKNYGTHLHFEIRKSFSPEPLGAPVNQNFQIGQNYNSSSLPYDPDNTYRNKDSEQYPYKLQISEVHSITPLRVAPGSNASFFLSGKYFTEKNPPKIPFCKSQSFELTDSNNAKINCSVPNEPGLQEGSFYNPNQPEDTLKYQIEIKDQKTNNTKISAVNYIPPKPGEQLDLHIRGYNLPGNLHIEIKTQNAQGVCNTNAQFSFLSVKNIRTSCRLPLNLGPVKADNNIKFSLSISDKDELLYSDEFQVNYGISAAQFSPKTANYYIPTRFTISGKNVHRSTVFFIEGCHKKDLKILSLAYDEVELECLIFPLSDSDLTTLPGQTFKHQYYFKTRSRYSTDGKNTLSDKEDEDNTILSGFIALNYEKSKIYERLEKHKEEPLNQSLNVKRKDGDYQNNGPAKINKLQLSNIDRQSRQQSISIFGQNLNRHLELKSDDCQDTAVSFGSSTKYTFLCLLKKVAVQEIKIVDTLRQNELYRKTIDVREVYEVIAKKINDSESIISINGVNLNSQTRVEAPACASLSRTQRPSSSELEFNCQLQGGQFSRPTKITVTVYSPDGSLLFDEEVYRETHSSFSKAVTINTQKFPIIDTELLRLNCAQIDQEKLYIGECELQSPFLRESHVLASLDGEKTIAILEGKFDTTIHQKLDQKLKGIRLNPASGEGLIIVDIPEDSILMKGRVKALGFDLQDLLDFEFSFDLYDYGGELLISLPDFDISKPRKKSKTVFGIGNGSNPQSELIKKYAREFTKLIKKEIKEANKYLNKESIEIANKLTASIDNMAIQELGREGTIQILKALEIVPEELIFYDNFDLTAKGKLKSEPFKPEKWRKNTDWILEANLAQLYLDFSAKDARLKLRGDILNSLSLLNNDIIKTDRGLINAGLTIALKEDHGRLDLDTVEIRLPGDIAQVKANAHFTHLFQPSNLTAWGDIKSKLEVYGVDLAKAGAAFQFDPNASYTLGDYETQGLFQLAAEMKLIALLANGRAVFTLPNDQLAIDLGGSINLDFLGYQKRLGDVLGRTRLSKELISSCFNSQSGTITFKIPIISNREITMRGGVSVALELHPDELMPFEHLILSGQLSDSTRIGFKLESNLLRPVSSYNQKCTDAPGEEFLQQIMTKSVSVSPPKKTSIISSILNYFIPSAQAEDSETPPPALWDINGWKKIEITNNNGNQVIVLDIYDNEVKLTEDFFEIPGLWYFSNPDTFVIYSEEDFNNSGYSLAIKKDVNNEIGLNISTYSNDQEISGKFEINNLTEPINSLNLTDTELDQQIAVNQTPIQAKQIEIRKIDEADRQIEAEVSSKEFTINESDYEPQPANDDLFPDIHDPELHKAVAHLTQLGIIQGYPDNTFRPEQTINRAEALKIIFEAVDTQPSNIVHQAPYPDVAPNQWFAPYVQSAKEQDIISGYPDGSYKPWQEVNRAEFIKIAMSALDYYQEPPDYLAAITQYSDLDINEWYMPFLSFAVSNGFLKDSNKFQPTAGMNRGEAAQIIYKMIH